jgi:hypothetical protein
MTVCKLHIFNQQNVPWNSEAEEFVLAAGFAGHCGAIDRFASTIFDKSHNGYDVSKSISALIANTFERPSFGGIFVTNKGVYRLLWAERMECKKYSHGSTLTMGGGTHVFRMLRLPDDLDAVASVFAVCSVDPDSSGPPVDAWTMETGRIKRHYKLTKKARDKIIKTISDRIPV